MINVFRMCGDLLHALSVCMILHLVVFKKNAQGLSRKTQELLLMVSILRYLDVFVQFYSLYNTILKYFYISSSAIVLIVMYHDPVRSTYNADQDTLQHWMYIFLPSIWLGACITMYSAYATGNDFDLMGIAWTCSIILESIALIPQAIMFRQCRRVRSLSGGGLLITMGIYRFLYCLNWVYRAHVEPGYRHHYLTYICGIVQAVVGVGGACCYVGSRDSAPLGPQLVHFYKSFKVGWVVTVLFVLPTALRADIAQDVSMAREEHRMRVVALLIFFFVAVLCLVCYCGFSSYKEETTELSAPLLTEGGAPEADERNATEQVTIIKRGIFIHGIQVV